ncbi:MAG: STAS-like domain-containing protein [Myxococcales bacterium]|nr:STAS-like domain-containing protein [Myxococcales bacterium]
MARIHIETFCHTKRVSRGDGAFVRRAIEERWSDSEPVVLDFEGVRIASVSFFDEALGLLARKHDIDTLKSHVKVENIDPADRQLLNRIVLARAKERRMDAADGSSPR